MCEISKNPTPFRLRANNNNNKRRRKKKTNNKNTKQNRKPNLATKVGGTNWPYVVVMRSYIYLCAVSITQKYRNLHRNNSNSPKLHKQRLLRCNENVSQKQFKDMKTTIKFGSHNYAVSNRCMARSRVVIVW